MNKNDFLKLVADDPKAIASVMDMTSELLTASLADTLYDKVGLVPMVKVYGVIDFLWEIEIYDAAFDLIQVLFAMADRKLPEVFVKLMADEETARDFVGGFLEDFLECLDDFCEEEYDCCLADLQDGELGG